MGLNLESTNFSTPVIVCVKITLHSFVEESYTSTGYIKESQRKYRQLRTLEHLVLYIFITAVLTLFPDPRQQEKDIE